MRSSERNTIATYQKDMNYLPVTPLGAKAGDCGGSVRRGQPRAVSRAAVGYRHQPENALFAINPETTEANFRASKPKPAAAKSATSPAGS